jgi:hypothetical protein
MGVSLVYEIVGDNPKKTATTSVRLSETNLLANLKLFGVAFATLLNNFIGGKILSAALVFDVDISGITANNVEVYSDVEEIAGFGFSTPEGTKTVLNVPSLIETVVIDTTNNLSLVATNVAAVIIMMEDGIAVTGGTIVPTDIGELDGLELDYAREQARGSGKSRSR